MWAPHLVIRGSPVSSPSRRAWGKVTAWVFFRWRDHRHGRAPWPGPHRGPAGRAGGPHASGARAGPSAGGYGSAALCLISSVGHPIPWGPVAGSPALVAGSSGNGMDSRLRGASPEGACQVEYRGAAICHLKVLPGRLGCGVRGSGPAAGPARRPRSGWRGRSCALIGPGERLRRVTTVRAGRPARRAAGSSGGTHRHAVGRAKEHAVPIDRMQAF